MSANKLQTLIQALCLLPGIGQKSAQRMVMHLLQHDREGARQIALALEGALLDIQHCKRCHTFTENDICDTCLDPARDSTQICIVETPADQAALDRTGNYQGLYFVLMGRINPLNGIGVHDIGLRQLIERVSDGSVKEAIIATSFTAEGEATAHIITQALSAQHIYTTRIARGVPVGSELEYVDLGTIAFALSDRR